MDPIQILTPSDWKEYELIDSGEGEKLERFANYILIRPDPRALWEKHLPQERWDRADASFRRTDPKTGLWETHRPPPPNWSVHYKALTFTLRPTEFKHVGVFPEQAVNWNWLETVIDNKPLNILNLFAYTGGATMAAALSGARVTHVDAVKSTITWANENVKASGLTGKPVRWIEDDVSKFVTREIKRGNKYDGIIMDPPRFGRGTKGEVWKLEENLPVLLACVKQILSDTPVFFLINAYTADISSLVLHHMVAGMMREYGGVTRYGELAIKESQSERLLPSGIFARWSKK